MNPKKGGGKPSFPGATSLSSKGKSVGPQYGQSSGGNSFGNNSPKVDQLRSNMAELSIDSANDTDWEVVSRNKNRGGTGAPKQWGSQSSAPKSWGPGKASGGAWQDKSAESNRSVGRGNPKVQSSNRGWENTYIAPPAVVPPPLQHGWKWNARDGFPEPKASEYCKGLDSGSDKDAPNHVDDDGDDGDMLEDTDDDILSDGFESDESKKSHESRKKNKWFKEFFEILDTLSMEEMNSMSRQWHCPACQNGPGAIDWYRGLQPLMSHAKNKGSKRVRLHREFAELLDEELCRKGTSVIPVGEAYGKWKGLRSDTVPDKEIVWPPMVVIMNTKLEQDENDKWIGMGNQELLDYFSSYNAVKARHSYGPKGHRGMSVLIFEGTPMGYVEAERLHNHFLKEGTHRDAWDHHPVLFYPGGERQLFGFMAQKEDMDIFNQHSPGKSKLKFEMRSYEEMVVGPMKQMSEDNQQLVWLKNKVVKEQRHSKALEESFGVLSEKLRKTKKENLIVRQRTKLQHEQNKEEMDYQEQFYKDQINMIHGTLEEKERAFEERLQEERKKVRQSNVDSRTTEDKQMRIKQIERFIESQAKGIEKFEEERERLIKVHEEKKAELKRRLLEEEVKLEKEFDAALTELMKQYSPEPTEEDSTSGGP
ncbi:XS domain [Macleaya cordata]|uniref:XS domain n=1 Tax=Macleaya cordata TaxID=56857 RepID=A0A200Q5R9_MACCD|nr:XS domain [Macleaya cordata]